MINPGRGWMAPAILIVAPLMAGRATAQVPYFPLVSVGYNIYRPAVPTEFFAPPQTFPARVVGSFRLSRVGEEEYRADVVRADYAAENAVMTVYDPWGASLRLVGTVTVATETTLNEDGGGTVWGTMTFAARAPNGARGRVFEADLSGYLGEGPGALNLSGGLYVPAFSPYEANISGPVYGALRSDAGLASTLDATAQITMW